jgi:hypothetical protein
MLSGFTAKPLALGNLLSAPYAFQVPSFQRPFSWTTKEAGQLLDDLTVALEEQANVDDARRDGYFLGAMLLTEPSPAAPLFAATGTIQRHDIIDGQQRLVTLTILLAVLRDVLAQRGTSLPAGLEDLIECRGAGGTRRQYRVELRGRERDFLTTYVQEPGGAGLLPSNNDLTEAESRILAVRDHFRVELGERSDDELGRIAAFVAEACHVALIAATSIDRAHRIFTVLNDRGRPLARNDILKAQILGQINDASRPAALAAWDRTAALLGEDFEQLFSHIRAIEAGPKSQIISGVRETVHAAGGARTFVETILEPYGKALHVLRHACHAGSPQSREINRLLTYLGWLGSSDWVPPALLWWRLHADEPQKLSTFLAALERFSYLLRLLGMGTDKRLARFHAVVLAIRRGVALDARNGPLQLSREEQRNILYNLRNLHTRSPLTCKLVLLRLNDELCGVPQHLSPADYTVEHILPQKPGRTSAWRSWFPSADEREACTNSIGNLVLVTREQNDRARNAELTRKLEIFFRAPGAPVPRITAELEGIAEWRAPQLLAREERLLSLVRSIWKIDGPKSGEPAPLDLEHARAGGRARAAQQPAE